MKALSIPGALRARDNKPVIPSRRAWDLTTAQRFKERNPLDLRGRRESFRMTAIAVPGEFARYDPSYLKQRDDLLDDSGIRVTGKIPITPEQLQLLTAQWLRTKAVSNASPDILAEHGVSTPVELAAKLAAETTTITVLSAPEPGDMCLTHVLDLTQDFDPLDGLLEWPQ